MWWVLKVTLVTVTAVGTMRTTGYRPFHAGSSLWVRILFTHTRLPDCNLWAGSDLGKGSVSWVS